MDIPNVIYLQHCTDGEITWCEDKIHDDDAEYISVQQLAECQRWAAAWKSKAKEHRSYRHWLAGMAADYMIEKAMTSEPCFECLQNCSNDCECKCHAMSRLICQRDAAVEVVEAARIIFDVTVVPNAGKCPHGTTPVYPTHAWWCDECWQRLEAALALCDEGIKECEKE